MENISMWLTTAGMTFGVIGTIGLALLTKVFITINSDGTQTLGPVGISNEEWKKRNIKIRNKQKYCIPIFYILIALGFTCQISALWIPKIL